LLSTSAKKAIACRPEGVNKACQADICVLEMQSQTTASTSQQDSQFTASSRHTDTNYSPDSDTGVDMDSTTNSSVEDIMKYLIFESELNTLMPGLWIYHLRHLKN